MKFLLHMLAIVCFLFNSIYANMADLLLMDTLDLYQSEWKKYENKDRIYIKEEAIYISDGKILLIVDNLAISLDRIAKDEEGIYIESAQLGFFGWTCPKCNNQNGNSHNACQNCGQKRPNEN